MLTRNTDGEEGGKHLLITPTVYGDKLYMCKAQVGDKTWFKGARKYVESSAIFLVLHDSSFLICK